MKIRFDLKSYVKDIDGIGLIPNYQFLSGAQTAPCLEESIVKQNFKGIERD